MKGSFKLIRFLGIDVFVHWTFFILVVWLGASFAARGSSVSEMVVASATVVALFACVVLHEFGHALAARRFGIGTTDITLLPIGGVARLERMPREPMQEFWVAVAGPAVNVVIAGVLAVVMFVLGRSNLTAANPLVGTSFLSNLFTINVVLIVFNMLPAFPMDGGRVLRSLLATRMNFLAATRVAARVGQMMAIVFAVLGLMGNPFLLFIALFVYMGAAGEVRMAEMNQLIGDLNVKSGMMTRFAVLDEKSDLGVAMRELLKGDQHDFPVLRDGQYVGMLRRADLMKAAESVGENAPVGDIASQGMTASEDDSLEDLTLRMRQAGVTCVPVIEAGLVVGLVTYNNVNELMSLRAAQSRRNVGKPANSDVYFQGQAAKG